MVKIAVNGRGRPPVQALYRVSTRSRCVRHSVYTGCCRNNRGRLDPILFARSLATIDSRLFRPFPQRDVAKGELARETNRVTRDAQLPNGEYVTSLASFDFYAMVNLEIYELNVRNYAFLHALRRFDPKRYRICNTIM